MMLSRSWDIAPLNATRRMHIFGRQLSGAARAIATPLRKQTEDGVGAALFPSILALVVTHPRDRDT
jgi:hypothetical protein